MGNLDRTHLEGLLDWLADEVAARLAARPSAGTAAAPGAAEPEARPAVPVEPMPAPAAVDERPAPAAPAEDAALEAEGECAPSAGLPSHAASLMARLAVGVLVVVALINIPLNRSGAALARMIPSATTLVVRDGLLVQEADEPHVYVYRDGQFHWITDLGVFERYGYRWENVHKVAPGFLEDYEIGRPVYLLAKCPDSPHIYRLENGARRWIVDIATLEAEGYQWSDVQLMDCYTLRSLPEGETIPPGRGPAPQP